MPSGFNEKVSRREWLRSSLLAGGTLLVGFDTLSRFGPTLAPDRKALQGGRLLGTAPFVGEARAPMHTVLGADLDGRLYTDLSELRPENGVTPTEKFFVRTRASELLDEQKPWLIRIGGLVKEPVRLTLDTLQSLVKPAGIHLMECAGNIRAAHFGMMSVADWAGAPLMDVLDHIKIESRATRVLISGFDRYPTKSTSSMPGASWIFTFDDLKASKAFLATGMNGRPLSKDHGAPVRLLAPGWYGCACIKWVNEITLVDETALSTTQMLEFANRTLQSGLPTLARDYSPAVIEQAAMPVRVEKWLVGGKIRYRVVGILWGGCRPVKALEIRFNPEEGYVPVEEVAQGTNDPWSFWTHTWTPKEPGVYIIRLHAKAPQVPQRRMDSGFFARSVEISEV